MAHWPTLVALWIAVILASGCAAPSHPAPSDFGPVQSLRDGAIYFTSFSFESGDSEIWMSNADGTERQQLSHLAERSVAAFSAAGYHGGQGKGLSFHPALSRDGRWLAFTNVHRRPEVYAGELLVVDLDTPPASPRDVVRAPYQKVATPAWSPDAESIAFVSDRETGWYEIWHVQRNGEGLRRLTNHGFRVWGLSWATDGTIAYAANPEDRRKDDGTMRSDWRPVGRWRIFLLDTATNVSAPVDLGAEDTFSPAWDSTSQRLAYVRRGADHWEIGIWDRQTAQSVIAYQSPFCIVDVSWGATQSDLVFTQCATGEFQGLFDGLSVRRMDLGTGMAEDVFPGLRISGSHSHR